MKKLNKGYSCYGTCYCDYTQKTCFSIINIFDQSKCNSIEINVTNHKVNF